MIGGRPADHVELVHIAKAVYVTAGIEQRAHGLEVPVGGSLVQRVGVVSGLARVRIRAVLEQQLGQPGQQAADNEAPAQTAWSLNRKAFSSSSILSSDGSCRGER